MTDLNGKKIGFALCGSFCTFKRAFKQLEELIEMGAEVTAIMSFNAASIDTRFGKASEHIAYLERITEKPVIKSIEDAEPVGPMKMFDALIIAPCTGNTLAKLALGITDTTVIAKRKQNVLWNYQIAELAPIKWIMFPYFVKMILMFIKTNVQALILIFRPYNLKQILENV